jgi:signal transduction histidine kinase
MAALAIGLVLIPGVRDSLAYWMLMAELAVAAVTPARFVSALLQAPRWSWVFAITLGAAAVGLMALVPIAIVLAISVAIASLCACYLGAGLARHLAMADARLLVWGDDGLVAVTRDLLLGRITSGMLHDMAQPLNVISMANGNMSYIVDHLEISDQARQQLQERVTRIATHTQNAASTLSLFRWFGRNGSDNHGELTVRSALERALAATRSNVRHHDVTVELQGNALDYLLPARHGELEMMAVAALLCSFASFVGTDGRKHGGKVLLFARLSPAHIVVNVECTDAEGRSMPGRHMDRATLWLIEQVAHEAAGDFRCLVRDNQPVRFILRLGRDDA